MNRRLLASLSILLSLLCGAAMGEEKPVLAVMTVMDKTGQASSEMTDRLTDYVRTHFVLRDRFRVVDKSRQHRVRLQMVRELRKESHSLCRDANCQVPLGKELSAEYILRTTISKAGSQLLFTGTVINLATAEEAEAAPVEVNSVPEGLEDRLMAAVRTVAGKLGGEFRGGKGETVFLRAQAQYGIARSGGESSAVKYGKVQFESDPPGAVVEIRDGEPPSEGAEAFWRKATVLPRKTPVKEYLKLGRNTVRFRGSEQFEPFTATLELKPEETLHVVLKPRLGNVVVRPRDKEGRMLENVRVILDGEEVAKAPAHLADILIGDRAFRFEAEGMRPLGREVRIRQNETTTLELTFKPLSGTLSVATAHIDCPELSEELPEARVLIDGQALGTAPLRRDLRPGKYLVEVIAEGAKAFRTETTVSDGKWIEVKPSLQPLDQEQCHEYVRRGLLADRTGFFISAFLISMPAGRYYELPLHADDEWKWGGAETATVMRGPRLFPFSLQYRSSYFSIEASAGTHEPINVDLGGRDVSSLSLVTHPQLRFSGRPAPLFPVRLDVELNFLWTLGTGDNDGNVAESEGSSYTCLDGAVSATWEVWQKYVRGLPRTEVAVGAKMLRSWGTYGRKNTHADPDVKESVSWTADGQLFGGSLRQVVPIYEGLILLLGGGYYRGPNGAEMLEGVFDLRVQWRE